MRLKHNKKRNTALVYEALVRELTKSIIKKKKDRQKKVLSIIKESFRPNSVLAKELEIYKALYETTDLERSTAEKVLTEAKLQYNKLNKREIFKQQSGMIKKINTLLSKDIYNNFVPNYKNIASIYSIFNFDAPAKEKVLLEERIVSHMSSSVETTPEDAHEPIDNIVYRTFVENFNKEYSDSLLSEQALLLNKYISSFADNGLELKLFLNEELGRLKSAIKSYSDKTVDDTHTEEQLGRVVEVLEDYKNQQIDKSMIEDVIKAQQLVREMEDDN